MEDGQEDNLSELEEASELQELVSRVITTSGRDASTVLPRYKQIVRHCCRLRATPMPLAH